MRAAENLAARAWFQNAKFGMFIHWGVSNQLMDGEWVMENRHLRVAEYERLADTSIRRGSTPIAG